MSTVKLIFISVFTWCICILFGAIVFNTLVFYPNVFYRVPQSLELTMQFLKMRGPHHFFPPFGGAIILLNIVSILFYWKTGNVRNSLVKSLLLLVVFEFIFSITFFWEKNAILFIEGQKKHSIEILQQTAISFQKWHWVRVFTTGLASILALLAFSKALNQKDILK
ncbi:MAG: DUF1772 domain-containing protein [Bacteroidota bacterium]